MRPLLACLLLVCAACGARVPPIPAGARGQEPAHAAPAAPWSGRGRIEVSAGSRHFSGDLLIRARGDSLAVVLLADGGVEVLSGRVHATGQDLVTCREDLSDHGEAILAIAAAWLHPTGEATWEGETRRRRTEGRSYRYGGDPVLLRRVEGTPWPVQVEDYRAAAGTWVAHRLIGEGPYGVRIVLRLSEVADDSR